MKVLPRLDIFKVRQLKGSPGTTQDTMEETGWDLKLGRILSKSWDKKGIFCGDFCAGAAKQEGTNGGNGPNKRRMPEPEVTARCRRLITGGGQDSSIQGALPSKKV